MIHIYISPYFLLTHYTVKGSFVHTAFLFIKSASFENCISFMHIYNTINLLHKTKNLYCGWIIMVNAIKNRNTSVQIEVFTHSVLLGIYVYIIHLRFRGEEVRDNEEVFKEKINPTIHHLTARTILKRSYSSVHIFRTRTKNRKEVLVSLYMKIKKHALIR